MVCPINVSGKERVYEDLTLEIDAETYSTIEEMASLADVSMAQLIKVILVQQLYKKGYVTPSKEESNSDLSFDTDNINDQDEDDIRIGGTD